MLEVGDMMVQAALWRSLGGSCIQFHVRPAEHIDPEEELIMLELNDSKLQT